MKKNVFILVLSFMLTGCLYKESAKILTGTVVVNVLDKEEYDDCHIPGSINMPLSALDSYESLIDKDAYIILYCSDYQCTGSAFVAQQLRDKGYKNIAVFEGGMAAWYQEGYPVDGECQNSPYIRLQQEPYDQDLPNGITQVSVNEVAKLLKVSKD